MSNTDAASNTRAAQARRAQAMHIRRIRRHVAAAGFSTFALAWAAIAALGSQGTSTPPKAATSISAPASAGTEAESVSPVTTRQS